LSSSPAFDVEPWEVAARDVEANPVASLENDRRRIHLDRELVGLSGLQKLGLAETVAVSSAHDAIGNIEIHTGRKVGVGRIRVDKLGCEIGIESVRGRPEFHDEAARNLYVVCERRCLESQYIISG
jgi:hypothetical protein